ncbi:MAG TPA: GGDEF domain-containing protein [Solirubrobacterales bacterium]|jgi:diguanylate cyclase (GGDEF)-like protein
MEARTSTRGGETARQVAREVSSLQVKLLAKLEHELESGDVATFAAAARELAEAFGAVSASAVGAVAEVVAEREPAAEPPPQMRRRLDQLIEMNRRYGHPFGMLVIDVEGPGARSNGPGGGRETVLAVVAAALRDSIRLVDESFRIEDDGICVLAPNQETVGGVQMAERLLALLDQLEALGGASIGIAAGVVACPDHGTDAEALLKEADEAMWRARALGQPVGVGSLGALQDR